jgi:hypothetical protein
MELNQHLVMRIIVIFFICSSKKLFVYNEEGLVLLCFIAFLGFSGSYFGGSMRDFFLERREAIKTELENFLDLKEDYLQNLEEILRSTSYNKELLLVLEPICIRQMNKLVISREQSLVSVISSQIQQKLRALNYSQKLLEERLQISIALGFRESVLEAFQFSKKERKLKLIREALQALKGELK